MDFRDLLGLVPWEDKFLLLTLKPSVKPKMPHWHLPLVLKVITFALFEPLYISSGFDVTMKVLFLVAITLACRRVEIHALLAKDPDTVIFPKVMSQLHLDSEVTLPSFCLNPGNEQERDWHSLDLVQALSHYLTCTRPWRKTNRFWSFLGVQGGVWLLQNRQLAIGSLVLLCFHTIRQAERFLENQALANSWLAEARAQPEAICKAARWSSLHTFIKYYKLNVLLSHHSRFGRKVLQAVLHS